MFKGKSTSLNTDCSFLWGEKPPKSVTLECAVAHFMQHARVLRVDRHEVVHAPKHPQA